MGKRKEEKGNSSSGKNRCRPVEEGRSRGWRGGVGRGRNDLDNESEDEEEGERRRLNAKRERK